MARSLRHLSAFLALFAVAAVVAPDPASAGAPKLTVLEYGLFEGRVTRTVPLPKSVSGRMNLLSGVRLKKKTDQVLGMLGRSFGMRYRITGIPPGERIVIRTEHPPLQHPKTGRTMNYSEREVTVARNGEIRYTGYSFDHRYELAEGIWKFKILYKGKVLGERKFNVRILLN